MKYPTLTACAETMLGDFFRQCTTREELQAREEAALVAIDRLYERRLREIKTRDQMQDRMNELLKGEDNE